MVLFFYLISQCNYLNSFIYNFLWLYSSWYFKEKYVGQYIVFPVVQLCNITWCRTSLPKKLNIIIRSSGKNFSFFGSKGHRHFQSLSPPPPPSCTVKQERDHLFPLKEKEKILSAQSLKQCQRAIWRRYANLNSTENHKYILYIYRNVNVCNISQ